MSTTPSDHAGADLRVENVKVSSQFIEALNHLGSPLPWDTDGLGRIFDAGGNLVSIAAGANAAGVADMIVVAINTCGSFRATRRDPINSNT